MEAAATSWRPGVRGVETSAQTAADVLNERNELQRLLAIAQREAVKHVLEQQLAQRQAVDSTVAAEGNTGASSPSAAIVDAAAAEAAGNSAQERSAPSLASAVPPPQRKDRVNPTGPRIYEPFSRYSWDQSSKFVKVYLPIEGLDDLPEEQIKIEYRETSLKLEVEGLRRPPANRRLLVSALGGAIQPLQCSHVRKANETLLLKLRKADDAATWPSLDDSAVKKELHHKKKIQANKSKSTSELLQQMYAEADEEGKAALSKAWEDGREKREGKLRKPVA